MADNSGNLFRNSLKQLKEENENIIKAKILLFSNKFMTPARPMSARPMSARPEDNIPLKDLIARAAARAVDRPASRAVDKPTAIAVARQDARPASRTSSRPASRASSRPALSASVRPASRASARQTAATAAPAISLSHLNSDIMELVGEQLTIAENSKYTLEKYKFVDGIPEKEIEKYPLHLLQNRNALYYLTEKAKIIDEKKVYFWLSSNTNPVAIELIKKALEDNENTRINWEALCKNHSAADILLNPKYRGSLNWDAMSKNTNPKVIIFLNSVKNNSENEYEHINWENLSANESPEAIALLNWKIKKHPWSIPRHQVSRNSGATGILNRYIDKVSGDSLSANTAEGAYYLLEKILEGNPKDINWASLSANPSIWAYKFLQKEENKKYIRWDMVSENTSKSAIKLLEKRIKEENELSETVYKALPKNQKINWLEVSRNPSAIELIKERIKYEAGLIEKDPNYYYEILNPNEKISYSELATNPSIFVKERYARPVAASAIAPAARRTSPVPPASPVARAPPPRAASARLASRASQAARVAAARVANNAKFNAELEELRAQRKQLQNTHLAPLASLAQTAQTARASRTQQTAARTTARTLRAQTLAASRADYRDIGRPTIRQPPRASRR